MNRLTQTLVNMAAGIVIILGMRAAAPMLTQVLVILFLAVVISPLYYVLRKLRLPSWLALMALISGFAFACLYGGTVVLSDAILDFSKQIPTYHAQSIDAIEGLKSWLVKQEIEVPPMLFDDVLKIDSAMVSSVVTGTGSIIGSFYKNMVLIVIIVSFILVELPALSDKCRDPWWMTHSLRERITQVILDVRRYMGVKAVISGATGLFVYIALRLMGIDSAGLLAVIAFALNFVPVIGSIIAAIPAVLIAIIQFDVMKGIVVAIMYLVVNTVFGNILEPRLTGREFGVSPVVVLFSVVFWGWVLGPLGMLLAVPLTMAARGAYISMLHDSEEQSEKVKN